MSPAPSLAPALQTHYEELVAYIQRRFPTRDFARDVIHEVCVQLLHTPPQQPLHAPLAYLRRVSLNRALDACRANDLREALMTPTDELPPTWAHTEDGAHALQLQQQVMALLAVVNRLPPRPRQCFLLHHVHGMAQQAIADAIGISRNAVSQYVRFAVQRIAEQWQPLQQHRASSAAAHRNRRIDDTLAA